MHPPEAGCRIALATRDDVAAIAALSRDAIEAGLEWSWTPPRVARSLRDRATNVIVARDGARLLGFAIMRYDDERAHLLLLAVAAAVRRRGIGTALLRWLEATARVAGIATIELEARADNEAAAAFYRRNGWRRTGIVHGYYRGMIDAVRLVRTLG
jgi:ribosomal-protein-alanine N-acetyltransferase